MTAAYRWFWVLMLLALCIVAGASRVWLLPVGIAGLLLYFQYAQPLWRREAIFALLLLAAGFIYALLTFVPPDDPGMDGETVTLSGAVSSYPQYFDNRVSFEFAPENPVAPALELIQVNVYDEFTAGRGDVLELTGKLIRPRAAGNPGQFDYRAYLEYQGIYYCLRVDAAEKATVIAPGGGIGGMLSDYRSKYGAYVEKALTPQEAAVLLGMVLGQREAIDEERYTDFQNTGVVHLFSVSGLHVGFLMLSLAVLVLYASLVGWPVPVTRAGIMSALLMAAYYWGRQKQSMNALSLAGIIILLLEPHALFTVSFQLSFGAAYGLVWLFPLLRDALPRSGRLIDALLIPLCAQLATLPLIIYYFHLFSPVSVPANLLVTWLAAAAVMCGFLTAIVFPFSSLLGAFFIYPAGMLVELIMRFIELSARLPGAYLMTAAVSPLLIAAYYLGLIILGLRWQRIAQERLAVMAQSGAEPTEEVTGAAEIEAGHGAESQETKALPALRPAGHKAWLDPMRPHWSWVALLLIALLFGQAFYPAGWRQRGELEVVFIDVGQGDAILIKSPTGKFIMVDGGGSRTYEVGEDVVLPYLYQRGVRQLDMMLSSHPDFDHTDGLTGVAEALPVIMAGFGVNSMHDEDYASLLGILREQETEILSLQKGDILQVEPGFTIEVLHPQAGKVYRDGDDNNDSLVLALRWREFSLLLTGDAEQTAQQILLRDNALKQFAAVKVPHHGSRSALTDGFYETVRPQVAVISVGANNSYGHPHPDVMAALTQQGIRVWRTDVHGAVTLLTDGQWLNVSGAAATDD
ncbi:MAG: ComEC/Rec2 family competence protein [Syntrophomonadaceae bacterium]|nr:ComEC/Rec2 family competence protein [Syntrophomonadaceae bacterium]